MTRADNSIPAFPLPQGEFEAWRQGMTLRDYFAAKAMQALLSDGEGMSRRLHFHNHDPVVTLATVASNAYLAADAMLKERVK